MSENDKLTLTDLTPLVEQLRPRVPGLAERWAPVFALMEWYQSGGRCPSVPELRASIDELLDRLIHIATGTVHGGSSQRGHVRVYVSQCVDSGRFVAGIELVGERVEVPSR